MFFYFVLDYLKNLPEDADDYKDTEGNDITFIFINFSLNLQIRKYS